MDEPVVLPIGTEVSAKYKGAFCEAKIKKISRNVRCKITPTDNQYSQAIVNETEVQSGQLKIGQTLSVRLPNGNVVNATLNKVLDQSQYTVVFDDGDVATLKRNSLCLKSGKHFAESDTLDQLPLTNPEHFGNPVSLGRRRTRKNIFSPGDTPLSKRSKLASSTLASTPTSSSSTRGIGSVREIGSESDSDSEKLSASSSSIVTTSTPGRKKELKDSVKETPSKLSSWKNLKDGKECWGKVVCLEYADKRGAKNKDSWFPALVISETANKSDLYTVKSFCDDRLYKVSFKDAKEFNKNHIKQVMTSGDCSPELKTAIEKAFKYLDHNMLPENWSLSPKKIPPKRPGKAESIGSADTGEDEQSNSSSLTSGSRRKLFKKFEDTLQEDEDLDDDFTDSNVEIEDDDDEEERKEKLRRQQQQQEARDMFVAQLYKCMDDRGTPINSCPMVNGKELNLYKLHQLVTRLGGPNRVTNKNAWKKIFDKLGLKAENDDENKTKMLSPSSKSDSEDSDESSGSGERLPKSPVSLLKKAYQKYVYPFYDLNRKLGSTNYIGMDFSRKASRPSRGERKREEERSQANTSTIIKASKNKETEISKKLPKKQDNCSETETSAKGSKNTKLNEEDIKAENTDSQVTAPSLGGEIAEFEDEIPGNEQNKFGESNIRIGDGLMVKYGKGKQLKVYEAKVLKTEYDTELSEFKYRVHYYGWHMRYDEWIYKTRIVEVLRDKSPKRRNWKVKNKGEPLGDAVEEEEEETDGRTHTKSESSVTPKVNKPPKNQASHHKERSNSLSKVKSSTEDSTKPQRRIRTSSYSEKTSQPSPRRLDKIKEEDKSNSSTSSSAKKFSKQTENKDKNKDKEVKEVEKVREEKIKEESDSEGSTRKKDRKRSREEEKSEKVSNKKGDKNDAKKEKEDKRKISDDEKKKTNDERIKRSDSISDSVKKRKEDKKADKKIEDNEEPEEDKRESKRLKTDDSSEKTAKSTESTKSKKSNEDSKTRRKSSAEEVKGTKGKASKEEKVIENIIPPEPEVVVTPPVDEPSKEIEVEIQKEDDIVLEDKKESKVAEIVEEPTNILPPTEPEVTKKSESFIEDLDTSPHSSLVIDEEDNDAEGKNKTQQRQKEENSIDIEKDKSSKKATNDVSEPVKTDDIEKVHANKIEADVKEPEIVTEVSQVETVKEAEKVLGYEAIDSPTPIGEENVLHCNETIPLSPISNSDDIEENITEKVAAAFGTVCDDKISSQIIPIVSESTSDPIPEVNQNITKVEVEAVKPEESLICDEKLFDEISDEEDILKADDVKKPNIEQNINKSYPNEQNILHIRPNEPIVYHQSPQQTPQKQSQLIQQQQLQQSHHHIHQHQHQHQPVLSLPMTLPSMTIQTHNQTLAMPIQQQIPKMSVQPIISSKPPKVIVPSNIATSIMNLVPSKNKTIREEEEDNKATFADDEEMDDDEDKIDTKKSIKMSKKRESRNVASKSSSVSNSPRVNRSPESSIDEDENSVDDVEDDDDDEEEEDEDTGSGGDKFERKTFPSRKRDIGDDKLKSPVQSPKKRRRDRTRSISSDVRDCKIDNGKNSSQLSLNLSASNTSIKEARTRRGTARKGPPSPQASLSDANNSDDNICHSYESNPKILTETIEQLSPVRDRPFDYTPWTLLNREKYYLLEPIDTTLPSGKIVEILTERINTCRKSYSELKAKLADAERRKKKLEREEKDREKKAAKEQAKAAKEATGEGSNSDSDSDNVSISKRSGIKKSSSVDSTITTDS